MDLSQITIPLGIEWLSVIDPWSRGLTITNMNTNKGWSFLYLLH